MRKIEDLVSDVKSTIQRLTTRSVCTFAAFPRVSENCNCAHLCTVVKSPLASHEKDDDDTIVTESIPWLEREFGKVLPSGVKVDEMPSPRLFKSHTPYHMMPGGVPHTSPDIEALSLARLLLMHTSRSCRPLPMITVFQSILAFDRLHNCNGR